MRQVRKIRLVSPELNGFVDRCSDGFLEFSVKRLVPGFLQF
jgi:hypothetical protein